MALVRATLNGSTLRDSDAPPELTVSIYAHNSALHIRRTIASILEQKGVRAEVLVVDDASTDNTSGAVNSVQDLRVRLIRNERIEGPAHSFGSALSMSSAPFIARMGAEDLMLPGGLRKLLQLFNNDPRIGMVHCYSFGIDQNGETTREAFRAERRRVLSRSDKGETVIDSIRIYNRAALEQVEAIPRKSGSALTHELDGRIAKHFDIKLLPEFHYARRIAARSVHLNGLKEAGSPLQSAVAYVSGIKRAVAHLFRPFHWKVWNKIVTAVYYAAVPNFSWWPIGSFLTRAKPKRGRRKIAYYIWHFPVLSQTFVSRELAALKQVGWSIEIIADGPESAELADENARLLLENTHYLDPPSTALLRKYGVPFFQQKPLLFLNLLVFVITHRHDQHKSLKDDLYLFARAAHLAQFLRKREIDHIHAPWTDKTAYIALLAARLCGITYSVQARAHDIHRKSYLYALREKFENAEFVITNTRYNQEYIQSLVTERHREKIELVYNGIDLDKFTPRLEPSNHLTPVRLLCVARLIEQKGFPYLLEALALLKKKGLQFSCDIIGGPEQPRYTDYLVQVRKLHRKLGLEDCVFFLGSQPFRVVMKKFAEADIFVLPCVIAKDGSRDITPNSLIEAMAMKLPVISTHITGIPEIVEDGISGLLVQPNDVDAVAEALERLIHDPKLRVELGEAGRRRVEQRFDIKRNIGKRVELFESLQNRAR